MAGARRSGAGRVGALRRPVALARPPPPWPADGISISISSCAGPRRVITRVRERAPAGELHVPAADLLGRERGNALLLKPPPLGASQSGGGAAAAAKPPRTARASHAGLQPRARHVRRRPTHPGRAWRRRSRSRSMQVVVVSRLPGGRSVTGRTTTTSTGGVGHKDLCYRSFSHPWPLTEQCTTCCRPAKALLRKGRWLCKHPWPVHVWSQVAVADCASERPACTRPRATMPEAEGRIGLSDAGGWRIAVCEESWACCLPGASGRVGSWLEQGVLATQRIESTVKALVQRSQVSGQVKKPYPITLTGLAHPGHDRHSETTSGPSLGRIPLTYRMHVSCARLLWATGCACLCPWPKAWA